MNARVFLLVLVTAAFMAVWDADRPAETSNAMAGSDDFSQAKFIAEQSNRHAPPSIVSQPWLIPDGANVHQNPNEHSELIPLPKSLQSGTWHAFNHDGDTVQITIERTGGRSYPATLKANGHLPANSRGKFCVITGDDGVRWCFIRQQPGIAQLATDVE